MIYRYDVYVRGNRHWGGVNPEDRAFERHDVLSRHVAPQHWEEEPPGPAWLSEESFPEYDASWHGGHGDGSVRHWQSAPDFRGRGPKGYKRSDERIREEVHERLTADYHLDASDMEVEVKDGEVTLWGNVSDRWARRRAEEVVEGVRGVDYVQNNLRTNLRTQEAAGEHQRAVSDISLRSPSVRPTPSIGAQVGAPGV